MVPQRLSTTLRRSASRAIRDGSAALALALSLAAGAAHAQVEDPNVLLPQRALSAPARGGR
ncbi:hypothetical protein L6R52_16130 [Myxococcota bacterium]|nr:hypothetical protein [Myxococcota bacterium]